MFLSNCFNQKTLREIMQVALLMPNIKYYIGNLTQTVITVAETAAVKLMPKEEEDRDTLAAWLNNQINNARYQLKKTITTSLSKDSGMQNIADLAAHLFSKRKYFSPTLSVYFRIALIRAEIQKNHHVDHFWSKVDDELQKMHEGGPEALVADLETCYEEDVDAFGDPSKSKCTPSTEMVGEKKPAWYRALHANVAKIQRVKLRTAPGKRKREEDDEADDSDKEPEDSEPPADEEEDDSGPPENVD
ncbi:hypothetical protein R3P38DRAFT_2803520 [Favolaschia claudopus]|uniref:Uncharacterized protein n=1 Tax=Favolaschia claudopus TaxID=2862362 RepID=A0AAV9ZSV7_9AGAR